MTPRTAGAHDVVTDHHYEGRLQSFEYWEALQQIINASPKDWAECDDEVKYAALMAVASLDLDGSENTGELE